MWRDRQIDLGIDRRRDDVCLERQTVTYMDRQMKRQTDRYMDKTDGEMHGERDR